jgi:hypothetical protein
LRPAGASELDEVGAQHFQHLGADQPHDQRHLEETEGQAGQNQRLDAAQGEEARGPAAADVHHIAAAERRQPTEPHRKYQNEDDADQERRQRHTHERRREQHLARHAASMKRSPDAERHAECDGDQHRTNAQLQRGRQALHQ